MANLAVLLSTYNGELFLSAQLNSLLNQSYKDFIIVARDDGSSDKSKDILLEYAAKAPSVFQIYTEKDENMGSCASFAWLMNEVLNNKKSLGMNKVYFMFCDQDDLWRKDKIEKQMRLMADIEKKHPMLPILVHSDLSVIDENDNTISNSFFDYQGLNINRERLSQLSVYNLVTGCTVLVNESLADLALPIPPEALMHDWWFALCVTAFGKRQLVSKPTVRYRRHVSNVIGAKSIEAIESGMCKLIYHAFCQTPPQNSLTSVAIQAKSFRAKYHKILSFQQHAELWVSSLMQHKFGFLQKLCYLIILSLPQRNDSERN